MRQRLGWFTGLLAFSGLALLGWYGDALLRTRRYQDQRSADFRRELPFRHVLAIVDRAPKPGALLGSISIPRVGVSSIILEGSDAHTLSLSVGHIPGTAIPGRTGNVALAAHRDRFFRGLQNIRKNDEILLTTLSGTRLYEVESLRIVKPEDVYVLNDVGRPVLTLVTCYPFSYLGAAPERFIVRAHLVG